MVIDNIPYPGATDMDYHRTGETCTDITTINIQINRAFHSVCDDEPKPETSKVRKKREQKQTRNFLEKRSRIESWRLPYN